jgi:hypothetical protein
MLRHRASTLTDASAALETTSERAHAIPGLKRIRVLVAGATSSLGATMNG